MEHRPEPVSQWGRLAAGSRFECPICGECWELGGGGPGMGWEPLIPWRTCVRSRWVGIEPPYIETMEGDWGDEYER